MDKLEEVIEGIWLGKMETVCDKADSAILAKAIRDAGYIHRSELLTDEAVERATLGGMRFVAEASGESVDGVALEWADASKDEKAELSALARSFIQAAIGKQS